MSFTLSAKDVERIHQVLTTFRIHQIVWADIWLKDGIQVSIWLANDPNDYQIRLSK